MFFLAPAVHRARAGAASGPTRRQMSPATVALERAALHGRGVSRRSLPPKKRTTPRPPHDGPISRLLIPLGLPPRHLHSSSSSVSSSSSSSSDAAGSVGDSRWSSRRRSGRRVLLGRDRPLGASRGSSCRVARAAAPKNDSDADRPSAAAASASSSEDAASDAALDDPKKPSGDGAAATTDLEALLRRADGAVTQAWASLLNGDLDDAVPSRPPPPLGSLVAVAGPAPEIDWHASTADPAAREAIVDALAASATFREPVVLRGAADEWPAVCDAAKSWTLARLVADHGGFEGDVRVRQPEAAAAQGVRPDTFLYVEEVGGVVGRARRCVRDRTARGVPAREERRHPRRLRSPFARARRDFSREAFRSNARLRSVTTFRACVTEGTLVPRIIPPSRTDASRRPVAPCACPCARRRRS